VRVLDRRAICDACGHTREWHDRDAARARLHSDPAVERPCYREIGAAPCRCSGFLDSGEVALPAAASRSVSPRTPLAAGLVALLLVAMGLALLYAYRSQTPSVPEVDITKAVQDVSSGQIRSVTIVANKATLQFRDTDAHKEQTTVPEPDTILSRAVADYNAANPGRPVELRYEAQGLGVATMGQILLSLLPLLLIGAVFYYFVRRARRSM
jgi:hypothetical protein